MRSAGSYRSSAASRSSRSGSSGCGAGAGGQRTGGVLSTHVQAVPATVVHMRCRPPMCCCTEHDTARTEPPLAAISGGWVPSAQAARAAGNVSGRGAPAATPRPARTAAAPAPSAWPPPWRCAGSPPPPASSAYACAPGRTRHRAAPHCLQATAPTRSGLSGRWRPRCQGRRPQWRRARAGPHRAVKYLAACRLAARARCSGSGPSTASIIARCSRFSCVWNSASPAAPRARVSAPRPAPPARLARAKARATACAGPPL